MALASLLLSAGSGLALAQNTYTWNGSGSGNFTDPTWSSSASPDDFGPPGSGDLAYIFGTVTLNGPGSTGLIVDGGNVTFAGQYTGNGLSGQNSASFIVDGNQATAIFGMGSSLNAIAPIAVGDFNTGTMTLSGGATVTAGIGSGQDNAAINIGFSAGSIGAINISGTGTTLTANGEINVGLDGQGTLALSGGATASSQGALNAAGAQIGANSHQNNAVTIAGLNSQWTNTGEFDVGSFGYGTLNITGGGSLVTGGSKGINPGLNIGYFPGSFGSVTISGADASSSTASSIVCNDQTIVGNSGTALLTVQNGATLTTTVGANTTGVIIANGASGNGTATVNANSTWTITGGIIVGNEGTGQLSIEAQGTVQLSGSNSSITIASALGSTGAIYVDGGTLGGAITSPIIVGQAGTANLVLDSGAIMSVSADVNMAVAATSGSTAVPSGLFLSDPMTSFTTTGKFDIGVAGTAVLSVYGGSVAQCGSAVIGDQMNSNGTVTIDGVGSIWHSTGDVVIGHDGTGAVTVQNGGTLQVDGVNIRLGQDAGSTGSLTITQNGGANPIIGFNSTGVSQLLVGDAGSGTLTVQGGAQISINATIIVGNQTNSEGGATVDGSTAGTSLSAGENIIVGNVGNGTLSIINGGTLTMASGALLSIGSQAGGTGLVEIGATSTVSLTFLQTNSTVYIADAGSGTLDIGPAAQVFTGDAIVANQASGNGTVMLGGSITGAAAPFWKVVGDLTIGEAGTGSVSVANSATLIVAGQLVVGDQAGSSGQLNVNQGAVAVVSAVLGNSGRGSLSLTGANNVQVAANVDLGAQTGSYGSIYVDANSSGLVVNSMNVGGTAFHAGGKGNFQLNAGGTAQVQTILHLWDNGTVDVGTLGGALLVGDFTSQLTAGAILVNVGGTLEGTGTVIGKVINDGTVSGALNIQGDFTQNSSGTLHMSISGTTSSQFDHLNVTGNLSLMTGTKLEFDFMNGFAPQQGEVFDFASYGTLDPVNNTFSAIEITGLMPGFLYSVNPDPVNTSDYALVALNNGIAVPEPGSFMLSLFGGAALLALRRRRA